MDLYLNKQLVDFEVRIWKLAFLGGRRLVDIVNGACVRLYRRFWKPRGCRGLLGRQGLQGPTEVERRAAEALRWAGKDAQEALRGAWEERWKRRTQRGGRR